jgi:hypothetical protein
MPCCLVGCPHIAWVTVHGNADPSFIQINGVKYTRYDWHWYKELLPCGCEVKETSDEKVLVVKHCNKNQLTWCPFLRLPDRTIYPTEGSVVVHH